MTPRVLHICHFAAHYPGAFILQLRMLDEQIGHRSAIAVPRSAENRQWLRDLHEDGWQVFILDEPTPLPRRSLLVQVRAIIDETGCEVVHSHFGGYDMALSSACSSIPKSRRPVQFWHYRTALETTVSGRSLFKRLKDAVKYRWYGRNVDLCIGVTEAMGVEAGERGMGARATAIVSGCDTDTFIPSEEARSRIRIELGIQPNQIMLFHMGWSWLRKGGDLLAAAVTILEERGHTNICARSVGAPDDEVVEPVVSLAMRTDIEALHQASDIFVSSSRSEGFGNGLIEAFACERVAVATLATGQLELFSNLPGCATAPLDDPEALADALEQMISQRDSWAQLGEKNRAHVVEHYSMRRWAREIAERYETYLSRQRRDRNSTADSQELTADSQELPSAATANQQRVLVVVDTLDAGGAERLAVDAACLLDRSLYAPHVLVTRGDGALRANLEQSGVPFTILNRRRRLDVRAWRSARKLAAMHDIIHTHKFGSNVWGALLARRLGLPFIAHEHNFSASPSRAVAFIQCNWIARAASSIVCVSSTVVDQLRACGVPAEKLRLIHNGVHLSAPLLKSVARGKLSIAADEFAVGIVARLRPEKAHELLFAAAAHEPAIPNLRLVVVGSGPQQEVLETVACELGIGDKVVWVGEVTDASQYAAAFDASVICSDWEGLPLSVLEAMAARTPVVATAVGGLVDLLAHDAGLLVPPRDAKALHDALMTIAMHPEAAAQRAQRAQQRVAHEFDIQTMVRTLESLYEEVISDPATEAGQPETRRAA